MYDGPPRGGNRGGQGEFRWDAVKADDKYRENYLGSTVNAPAGRWQKNKDVHWYARDNDPADEGLAARQKREEMKRLKEAEEEALAVALGFAPTKKAEDIKLGESAGGAGGGRDEEIERLEKEEKKREKELRKEHRALKRAEKEIRRDEREQERDQRRAREREDRKRDEDRRSHIDTDDRYADRKYESRSSREDPEREYERSRRRVKREKESRSRSRSCSRERERQRNGDGDKRRDRENDREWRGHDRDRGRDRDRRGDKVKEEYRSRSPKVKRETSYTPERRR